MTNTQTKYSTVKATKGDYVLFLSELDEQNGLDIKLDMQGYEIEAL